MASRDAAPPASKRGYALFLDFDGTLADLAPHPDAVAIDADLGDVLARLAARLDGALAIVTGRPITVIDRHFAPHRFDVAGLHGAELRLRGTLREATRDPRLPLLAARLRDRFALAPGVIVEDKGGSVAVHWRLAPDAEPAVALALQDGLAWLGPGWRLLRGKAVLELLPAAASKGDAIRAFLQEPPFRGRRPVFAGDDVTDEDGFAFVQQAGGLAFRVGPEPTLARRRISSPAALRRVIRSWASGATPPEPKA
jgi:trehalose 6-phosphate phosphatase